MLGLPHNWRCNIPNPSPHCVLYKLNQKGVCICLCLSVAMQRELAEYISIVGTVKTC